jgi:uncharacterized RDD family membrane protein YckC
MEIARYEKRVFGWLIDRLLSWLLGGALFYPYHLLFGAGFSPYFLVLLSILSAYLLYVLGVTFFLWISNGRTLGSLFLGTKSFHPDGERLSFADSFLKALLTGVVAMAFLNALYMLFSHTERSAFDRLTNTLVVDVRAA